MFNSYSNLTLILLAFWTGSMGQSFDYNFNWSRNSGPNIISSANTLAVDSLGYSYVAGSFTGGYMTLGSLSFNAIAPTYIAKLNPNGTPKWLKAFGTNEYALINKLKLDRSGNILLAGFFTSSTLTLGPHSVSNVSTGQEDAFMAKLDTAGNCVWLKSIGGINHDIINDFVVRQNNKIEFVGEFKSDTVHADSLILTSQYPSMDQNMVGLLTDSGRFEWFVHIGNSQFQNLTSIALEQSNCIMVGYEESDIAIFKLDSMGNIIWNKVILGDAFEIDQANDVLSDSNKNLYVVGYFESPYISFDTISFGGFSGKKGFLLKMDSLGNAIWMKPLRGNGDAEVRNITMNDVGDILVSGDFYSSKFYPELLDTIYNQSYTGYADCFISSYQSDGTRNWTKQLGSVYNEVITELIAYSNKLVVAGYYDSPFFTITGTLTMFNNTGHEVMFVAGAENFIFTKLNDQSSSAFHVFPNPTTDILNVKASKGISPQRLVITDVSGKIVLDTPETIISLKDLDKGMYFIQSYFGNKLHYSSFIKN